MTLPYEEAAERRTLTGWCCKSCGRYWAEDEHMARYCCAAAIPCRDCGLLMRKNSWCEPCHKKRRDETYAAMPQVEWEVGRVDQGGFMNHTKASCGCIVPAIGAPGSMARYSVERFPCAKARCRSRLPERFSDAECEAYLHLRNRRKIFVVDLLTRAVTIYGDKNEHDRDYPSLIEAAKQ